MTTEAFKLFLSIWGATLSTLLGILTIIKFKKDNSLKLSIIGTIDEPFEHVRVSIANLSNKPGTLIEIEISIGSSIHDKTQLLQLPILPEKKLTDSDIWTTTILRGELLKCVLAKSIEQKPFQRLIATVKTSSKKNISEMVFVHPKIIGNTPYYEKAEQFIATDLFLGFKQMDSESYPIGIK